LIKVCEQYKVNFLSTPFDADSLQMLRDLGVKRFKIASSEADRNWWRYHGKDGCRFLVSWPWGEKGMSKPEERENGTDAHLTAIPLYPTPLECVAQATILDGWSDHTEGLSACYRALALGAKILEVHVCMRGRSREMPFDKSCGALRLLRDVMDDCETMRTGVAQRFRERWSA
jgi:sialic acid synthase SpsE